MRPTGRFAPSPSGYLHPGNLLCALLAWLSCRSQGGRFLLRIEDVDPGRCPRSLAKQAMDDLAFLGLTWDEPPLFQSERSDVYRACCEALARQGLVYPCFCSRAELRAAFAPNQGEVNVVYDGRCRRLPEAIVAEKLKARRPALRLAVPDETIAFTDMLQGDYAQALKSECGDFILRRGDGIWAYALAVVADDAASGVTEVVRGRDILPGTPRQILLQRLLGYDTPAYAHIPLLTDSQGRRLAKRDGDVSLAALSKRFTKEEILGLLGAACGLLPNFRPVTLDALLREFDWAKVPKDICRLPMEITQ